MKGLEEQKSGQRATGPGKMEKKCRSCGASTEFRDHTLFSRSGLIMPAEVRLCPKCESVSIVVVDHLANHGPTAADEPASYASRLRVERHEGLLEVMCPKCGASMFFVQHSHVSFRDLDVHAESWICECGTTLEIAKDSEIDPNPAHKNLRFKIADSRFGIPNRKSEIINHI